MYLCVQLWATHLHYFVFKAKAFVTTYTCWYFMHLEPFVHKHLYNSNCLLTRCHKASLNLENVLVRTRTLSLPSLEGSNMVNLKHNKSKEYRLLVSQVVYLKLYPVPSLLYNMNNHGHTQPSPYIQSFNTSTLDTKQWICSLIILAIMCHQTYLYVV